MDVSIPEREYLNTSYEMECEYVDGVLLDRHSGERDHSRLQGLLCATLAGIEQEYDILSYLSQRVRVAERRYRVPDLCAMPASHRRDEVLNEPPLLVLEVVSRIDGFTRLLDKIEDYHRMGVRNICVADPRKRRVFLVAQDGRLFEAEPGNVEFVLREDRPPFRMNFAALFEKLD